MPLPALRGHDIVASNRDRRSGELGQIAGALNV
jgi:hypothetical protein